MQRDILEAAERFRSHLRKTADRLRVQHAQNLLERLQFSHAFSALI
jgi:hypothetical protein